MLENNTKFDTDKLLDEVLRTEPEFTLPDNFADQLAEEMATHFAWKQYLREFLIYLGVILGIVAITGAMTLIWFNADWPKWLTFITENIVLVAGANLLLVFVLFADKVLLRYFMFKTSSS